MPEIGYNLKQEPLLYGVATFHKVYLTLHIGFRYMQLLWMKILETGLGGQPRTEEDVEK